MKQVHIIAQDATGRTAVLRLETNEEWTPLELRDVREGEPFIPAQLSDIELHNGDSTKTSILRYAVPVTFRCYT